MKETEFRARLATDHISACYIIEKRVNGWFSKWKEVARPTKIGDATAEKELAEYMKTHLNVEPTKDDSAYARIKRL
jgi:hypothetical protein